MGILDYTGISHLHVRDIIPWPSGNNDSDTAFQYGPDKYVHLNLTVLKHFNYSFWTNKTVSNGTKCYLMFDKYIEPTGLFDNGTFNNATTCFNGINPIGTRGHISIALAVVYGLGLVFTLTCLTKHGKTYLPRDRRFFPIGRRWQWYWACITCVLAIIGLFANIDVDRYYVLELPMSLTIFFWFLLCMSTVNIVWEAVRHWGSWQERQFIDPDPFVYKQDDRRAKTEFWLPMIYYLWVWMNFFMVIPRGWGFPQMQRTPEQAKVRAQPEATSIRFKIAGFFLALAWFVICYSLRHSIQHYKDRHRGIINSTVGLTRAVPLRFYLIIPLAAALIAYQITISFIWELSVVKVDGSFPAIFAWGYGPPLLIVYIQIIYGWSSPNEDKELLRQRRDRGEMLDRELGIVRKPAWWRRIRGEHIPKSMREIVAGNVKEVGGGRGTGRRVLDDMETSAREEALAAARNDDDIEMQAMPRKQSSANNPRVDRAGVGALMKQLEQQPEASGYGGKNERRRQERTLQLAAGVLFPNNHEAERARREASLFEEGPPPYTDDERGRTRNGRPSSNGRSNSTETTNSITAPPHQVRSMLDI